MVETESDHLPVQITTRLLHRKEDRTEKRHIPRKRRRNQRLLARTWKCFTQYLSEGFVKENEANEGVTFQEAYDCFKKTLLWPWEITGKRKENKIKTWRNDSHKSMAKTRKHLYMKALKSGDEDAKTVYTDLDKCSEKYEQSNKEEQQKCLK